MAKREHYIGVSTPELKQIMTKRLEELLYPFPDLIGELRPISEWERLFSDLDYLLYIFKKSVISDVPESENPTIVHRARTNASDEVPF